MLLVVTAIVSWFMFFFFKQKTAYDLRISDWSSDVCSSDLAPRDIARERRKGSAPRVNAKPHRKKEGFAKGKHPGPKSGPKQGKPAPRGKRAGPGGSKPQHSR